MPKGIDEATDKIYDVIQRLNVVAYFIEKETVRKSCPGRKKWTI